VTLTNEKWLSAQKWGGGRVVKPHC